MSKVGDTAVDALKHGYDCKNDSELARRLAVHPSTVTRWRERGLPGKYVGAGHRDEEWRPLYCMNEARFALLTARRVLVRKGRNTSDLQAAINALAEAILVEIDENDFGDG